MAFTAQSNTPGSGYFSPGTPKPSVKLYSNGIAADALLALPAYHAIRRILILNRTANAVTGGLDIGTSVGGQQVLAAKAVAASAVVESVPVASVFLATAQSLSLTAASAWNSAVLDVVIECDVYDPVDAAS
jgi:hypothetical protein